MQLEGGTNPTSHAFDYQRLDEDDQGCFCLSNNASNHLSNSSVRNYPSRRTIITQAAHEAVSHHEISAQGLVIPPLGVADPQH